jgi:[ribosomal protein S5]-alanine N-acetyltransferase
MNTVQLQTERLNFVLRSHEETCAQIAQMKPEDKAQLSPAWLALLAACTAADPWIHGFTLIDRKNGTVIGSVGFKGPPADGIVEIAYGINPEHQGQGYATEAAAALVRYAFGAGRVHTVRAHTLPASNASARVLTKCGFRKIGEVIDPDDGLVWRWETP